MRNPTNPFDCHRLTQRADIKYVMQTSDRVQEMSHPATIMHLLDTMLLYREGAIFSSLPQ